MNFKSIGKITPIMYHKWCVVECYTYSPSGFHIAKFNGLYWENESGESIQEYVEGWFLLE